LTALGKRCIVVTPGGVSPSGLSSDIVFVISLPADWTPRRAVALELELPQDVADEIERLQHNDPDLLGRMLGYAALRAACFEGIRDGIAAQRLQDNT
jgi:hypothetical protein